MKYTEHGTFEITKLLAKLKGKRSNDKLQLHVLGRSD